MAVSGFHTTIFVRLADVDSARLQPIEVQQFSEGFVEGSALTFAVGYAAAVIQLQPLGQAGKRQAINHIVHRRETLRFAQAHHLMPGVREHRVTHQRCERFTLDRHLQLRRADPVNLHPLTCLVYLAEEQLLFPQLCTQHVHPSLQGPALTVRVLAGMLQL